MDRLLELQTHELEEHHWWYRGRREVLTQLLRGISLPPGARILDAGCGSGRNMVDFARLGTVTGVEISDASVVRAREREIGEVVQCSITELPFADGSFDLAFCLDVIEHIEDDRRAMTELYRVVAPGGTLVVMVPAYQWLWSEHDVINHHERRYSAGTLRAPATEAGWQQLRTTYFNGLLLPVAIVHRRLTRRSHLVGEPVSDLHRTGEPLNTLLEWPLRLEARLIGMGVRIPVGLSLAAVFNKPA
jgi:ubiquinone/menaquinone biosynthesis C-methylase UbiE